MASKGGEFLSHYGERKAPTGRHVRQTTRRTKHMKRAIVGLVGLLVVVMIVWPLTNMGKRSFKVNLAGSSAPADDKPHMIKPRLHGMDKDGQPYNVTARDALQEDKDNVMMQEVSGDVALKDGGWVSLTADTGHYNVTAKTLDLLGAVNVVTDSGYELTTETARALLHKKEVQGDVSVHLQGPLGTLVADGFNLQGATNTIIFKGNVHLKAYPSTGKKK